MSRTEKILKASKKVKEQYLQELLTKMNDGTGVTKKEVEVISKLESDLAKMDSKQEEKGFNFETNVHGVADFFGVTIRTVQLWTKTGSCPKEKHGLYNLKAVFNWWKESIGSEQDSRQIEDVKLDYWRAKADRERFRADAEKGEYFPKSRIVSEWAARMGEVTAGLVALSDRIPPLIEGKDRDDQRDIIAHEVWALRDNYCREGVFCPPTKD
jgi:hypothetical protein